MCFRNGTKHVLPVHVAGATAVNGVMTGAARVDGDSVETLHAHTLLSARQVRKHGRTRVMVAGARQANGAVLAIGRGAELL
ncbi:hypothetical protein PS710_00644 [Pseudomonas fluorescens]|uniref:Uncharacterized protein n=1 Tax=Pseudomonas fluorescens TaxID=294 RepID=A0A5E7AEH3_PSEFL|nr:hypothetical protein PS710_00644 [Pseudomonas fluorescens]